MRLGWVLPLLCCGCHLADSDKALGKAERLWQEGQAAMAAGKPDDAIALYHQSLAEDRQQSKNHLSLAAAHVEKGEHATACEHLRRFLDCQPEHKAARFYYAELLLRLQQPAEAGIEYERAIAAAQQEIDIDYAHVVHCHTRLVAVAEALEDEYHAHLHRGIGMYLLGQERLRLDDPDGELSVEALLCKAVAELARARALRPEQARPCWYLHCAWRQLAQQQSAQRWLQAAAEAAPYSYLTSAEQTNLELARQASSPAPRR